LGTQACTQLFGFISIVRSYKTFLVSGSRMKFRNCKIKVRIFTTWSVVTRDGHRDMDTEPETGCLFRIRYGWYGAYRMYVKAW